uniref:Inos-1-P_synth domain-containing protein n=1 Tax=Caenorhabditis tropicalis TaxID=1561998 RepID=A0A1I7UN18_9PELO
MSHSSFRYRSPLNVRRIDYFVRNPSQNQFSECSRSERRQEIDVSNTPERAEALVGFLVSNGLKPESTVSSDRNDGMDLSEAGQFGSKETLESSVLDDLVNPNCSKTLRIRMNRSQHRRL